MNCLTKPAARLIILSAAALSALTGCVNDSSLCPEPGSGEAVQASFQFSVVTRGSVSSASRAANLDPESTQDATAAENELDLDHTQFLIFDNDRRLLAALFPQKVEKNSPVYTATVTLSLQYFDDAVAADKTDIPFYIMVIGNCSGITATKGQTIDEIVASQQPFKAPLNLSDTQGWTPSIADNRLIPMSGLRGFSVSADQLMASSPDNPMLLSTNEATSISMVRALAKIEVIDNITENFTISAATLNGFFTTGAILPAVAQWPNYTSQDVKAPTMAQSPLYNFSTPLIFSRDDGEQDIQGKYDRIYSVYVPEYLLSAATDPAVINVTLDPTETGESINRTFKIAQYDNGTVQELEQLRRNHIYRFEVTSVSNEIGLIFNYVVCPMTDVTSGDITFN